LGGGGKVCGKGLLSAPGHGAASNRDEITRVVHRLVLDEVLLETERVNGAGYSTVYIAPGPKPLPNRLEMVTRTKRTPTPPAQPPVAAPVVNLVHELDSDPFEEVRWGCRGGGRRTDAAKRPQTAPAPRALEQQFGKRLSKANEKLLYDALKALAMRLSKEHNLSKHFYVWCGGPDRVRD
jgi:hypothetical protein